MKSRIRRISQSVDISFGGSSSSTTSNSSSSAATSTNTIAPITGAPLTSTTLTAQSGPQTITKTQSSDFQHPHHCHQSITFAGMSSSGKHSSQDSALGSTTNNSIEQPLLTSTSSNSRSLDIQGVPESRIEKMRKLLSSPLLRKRGPASCHHTHHVHRGHHHSGNSNQFSVANPQPQPISRDANSSPSSSPSSSPALVSSASMRTFGVSLESLAHHQHPHHQQPKYEGQDEGEDFYYRDPELVVVPHQKAAHILGQACAGCLTSAPSNSSSMGSIHESSSSGAVHHAVEETNATTSSPGTSSSSTTSSTSSVHGCGQTSSSSHYLIPYIVTRLCGYIETNHGLEHEGLFRVSGNAKLVERLKKLFDETGDAPLEKEGDLGSATTLLKQFLRELPHPLIPNGAQFIDVLRSLKNEPDVCILALKSLISQLPDENYYTLRYLMKFLHRIDLKREENRMSATNLGIVFAPNLFRVCVDTYQGLKDQSTANEVVYVLITDFMQIFGEDPCPANDSDLSRPSLDDLSVDLSECQFAQGDEQSKHSGDDNADEKACTRSLIDFRSEESNDLDRKRRDYQSGYSTRSNVEEYYDTTDSHPQQRSQSVELGMDQFSNKTKTEVEVERTASVKSTSGVPASIASSSRAHADIIVTNSSDSVSTDDNTATTATSTGATVCSVLIGGLVQRGKSLEPGSAHLRHFSSSGDEAQDRSGSLPIKTARSGSCSSDCTENQNLKISLSDDDGEDGSLSHSIASACLTDDGEESDDTSSSILDGDTSGNEAGSSSSMNETEPEVQRPEIAVFTEELAIEPNAWQTTISRPTLLDLEADAQGPSRNNSVKTRQNKRFSSIRRKLRQFETDFCQENGFAPSFEHKMASSFARPLMLELSTILNVTTPSLREIDIDAADPAKTDHYREASPTRSTFNARQQANKRFPVNWRGPSSSNTSVGLAPTTFRVACPVPVTTVAPTSGSTPGSGLGMELTNDEIFNTIFGRTADKHLEQLRETMAEIEQKLMDRRLGAGRPEDLEQMTAEEIQDEKLALQKALLRFEALYGRPSTKAERDIVRHVYDRYRAVKRKASNAKGDIKSISGQLSSISTSVSTSAISANELAPIIENVQMDFKSPTVSNKSAILLEFEAEKNRSSSPTTSSKKLSQNYHEMSQQELEKEFSSAKQQKRNVRMVLRTFENDFQKRTGRRVEREDRCNMAAAYSAYKNIKAKIRLIEALLKKNHEGIRSTDDN